MKEVFTRNQRSYSTPKVKITTLSIDMPLTRYQHKFFLRFNKTYAIQNKQNTSFKLEQTQL